MKIKDLYEWAVAHNKTEEDIDITPEFACLRSIKKDRSEDCRSCSECKHHYGEPRDIMFCHLLHMPSETSFYGEESIAPWDTCDFFEAE